MNIYMLSMPVVVPRLRESSFAFVLAECFGLALHDGHILYILLFGGRHLKESHVMMKEKV